jgi:pimeloyl-ACP methyl ester carboxylesterase
MKNINKCISTLRFFGLCLFFIIGCSGEEDKPKNESLVEATAFLSRSSGELKTFIAASGLQLPLNEIQYDVDIYKVKYNTLYKGEVITASGLVILPKTTDAVGMLSFQHGTIVKHSDAPSALPLNSSELVYYSALSTLGFIAAVPDYIGFGSSSAIQHPYYVEEYTAGAIIDLLKAAKELAVEKNISFNQKLFLAGYSQGGYATMATHKAIEEKGLNGFNLIASFPASGGYNVKAMQEYFFDQETYHEPFYLAFLARAYQTSYDWTSPLTDFFNEPYAEKIPLLFDGSKNGSEINEQLTNTITDLVSSDLRMHIDTDSKYNHIVDGFNQNSLVDWIPSVKMYLYHGDADITVPYQNSILTYETLLANGASTNSVSLTTLIGADHGSGVKPYIEDFIPKIISLK